jgi:hypothetical protein
MMWNAAPIFEFREHVLDLTVPTVAGFLGGGSGSFWFFVNRIPTVT